MENNNEQQFTKEIMLVVPLENKEVQTFGTESFFTDVQKSITEGESVKQEEERSTMLLGLENFGEQCGLTKDEVKKVLEEKGFVGRLGGFQDSAIFSCDKFITQARKIGATAVTTLVLGMSAPAPAYSAEQVVGLASLEQVVLPTHDEAMAVFHKSVLTDKNERALVSVRGKDGVFRLVSLIEGSATTVKTPDELKGLIEKGEEVEDVHTHPLEAFTFAGLMNIEEIALAREGKSLSRVMPPSGDGDFLVVIEGAGAAQESGAKVHYKVVDPTGEWSYEISDRKASFVMIMSELIEAARSIGKNSAQLTLPERKYLDDLSKEFPDQRIFANELRTRATTGGGLAKVIYDKTKFEDAIYKIIDSASIKEKESLGTFTEYLSGPKYHGAETIEQKNANAVEFYEKTAQKLGFSLTYTPNKKAE